MRKAIVVGLGGMGSAAAYHLARRGVQVVGIERFSRGHVRGSSHGHSRVIRQAYFEHPDYVPLLLRAYELWRELERDVDLSLMTITGGLMIGGEESPVFQGSLASAREHRLEHEVLDAAEIHRRYPPLTPAPNTVALFEKLAGVLRPEQCVAAHCDGAVRHGADLRWEERLLDWHTTSNGVRVVTDRNTYEADSLIIAPGAWASDLFHCPMPLKITRQTLYWFEPLGGMAPYSIGRFPIYIWQTNPGDEFYGFPATRFEKEPAGVKIAYFYRNQEQAPDEERPQVTREEIEAMREAFRDKIPSLDGRLMHAVTCLYTETPDHHFAIGRHPGYDNVVLASPCSGHGFKFCSVMGEILADLAIDQQTRHPVRLFDLARWGSMLR